MSKRQLVSIGAYRHLLTLLKEAKVDFESISRALRECGEAVSADKLGYILNGKVDRTGAIASLPYVFFEMTVEQDEDHYEVARDAYLHYEAMSVANEQGNSPMLLNLVLVTEGLYDRERSNTKGFAAYVLDFVLMYAKLIRVVNDKVAADPVLDWSREELCKRELAAAAELGDAAIRGLHSLHLTNAVRFFLVRAVENSMVIAAELDARRKHPDVGKHDTLRKFASRVETWAIELLLDTARSTRLAVVAWNAAELAAITEHHEQAVEALMVLFSVCPPNDGAVSLVPDRPKLVVDDYLSDAYAAALTKLTGSEEGRA